jgi:hypothetical protein
MSMSGDISVAIFRVCHFCMNISKQRKGDAKNASDSFSEASQNSFRVLYEDARQSPTDVFLRLVREYAPIARVLNL